MKRLVLHLAIIAVLFAVIGQGKAIADEYIVNGDFEAGPIGWLGEGEWILNDGETALPPSGDSESPISGDFDVWGYADPFEPMSFLFQVGPFPEGILSANLSWSDRIINLFEGQEEPLLDEFVTGVGHIPVEPDFEPGQEVIVSILDLIDGTFYDVFRTYPGDEPIQYEPNNRSFDITSLAQSLEGKPVLILISVSGAYDLIILALDDVSLDIETIGAMDVEVDNAKVCWHHSDVHVKGELHLPEGFWMDNLNPVGSSAITLAGVEVVDQSVEFEIGGKNNDKWEYKDKENLYGNIKEFKIDWKGSKFDYKGDDGFHIHTHFISGSETTFCIHTGNVSGAFTVAINETTIAYDEERNITTGVAYEPQKEDNTHVHFTLPFELTSEMTIEVSGAIELDINVADYYTESSAKFKVVSSFDSELFPEGSESLPDELEYGISLDMLMGSDMIDVWTKKDNEHWEY